MTICRTLAVSAAMILLGATTTAAQDSATATAELKNVDGQPVGQVQFQETPHGLIVTAKVTGLPEGAHGFHIHAVGQCEPPFDSAGGHFNPDDHQHGIENPEGMHAGDLPNLTVPASGEATVEHFAEGLALDDLSDDDGSAVVIHANADDYATDPAGNAGDRIACGVVSR